MKSDVNKEISRLKERVSELEVNEANIVISKELEIVKERLSRLELRLLRRALRKSVKRDWM